MVITWLIFKSSLTTSLLLPIFLGFKKSGVGGLGGFSYCCLANWISVVLSLLLLSILLFLLLSLLLLFLLLSLLLLSLLLIVLLSLLLIGLSKTLLLVLLLNVKSLLNFKSDVNSCILLGSLFNDSSLIVLLIQNNLNCVIIVLILLLFILDISIDLNVFFILPNNDFIIFSLYVSDKLDKLDWVMICFVIFVIFSLEKNIFFLISIYLKYNVYF